MFKGLLIGIVLGVLLLVGGVAFYFLSGRAPVAVTDPPFPFEKKMAHGALDARIDRDGEKDSPIPANEATYLAGAEVYKENCAVCHGLPNAPKTTIAQGMYPPPPQLFHGKGVTDDAAGETYWKAENGIRLTGMPGFKGKLTEQQIWQVSVLLANADKISPAVNAVLEAPNGALADKTATEKKPETAAPAAKKK